MLSAAIAIAYALRIVQSGIQQAVDTATYSRWADLLIAHDFNVAAYLREQSFVAPPLTYLLWVVVVAGLKVALGTQWMTGVVAMNWLALTGGAYATLASVRRATLSSAEMLLAAALFFVAAELLIFVRYVLSDLIFWGLSTTVLACGVRIALLADGDRTRFARLAIAGSALIITALLFRPVAIPLLLFWLIALATYFTRPISGRFLNWLLMAVAAGAVIAVISHAYVLAHPNVSPFGLPQILNVVAEESRRGMFVHNANPPLLVAPAQDWLGFVRITLQKLMFFITPWLPHYSVSHTLINLLFFVPAYGLSAAAMANRRRLTEPLQRVAVMLAAYVVMLPTFHALLLVDSDHRYRLPLLPALIMLAAIGLESVRRPRTLASIARAR